MSKTERLYRIQRMLTDHGVVSADRFIETLEISRATFKRDLEYLRDRIGTPIIWDAEAGGYRIEAKKGGETLHTLPGLWLNEAEISGLLASVDLLSKLEPTPLIGKQITPIRARLEKILELNDFPSHEIKRRIKLIPLGHRKTEAKFFQVIAHAVLSRKRIEIRHFGRVDAQHTSREVSPLRLVYYRDNWYLDAFCHMRDDIRSFSIDAIVAVNETDKVAVSVEDEILSRQLDAGYGIFAGKQLKTAKLKFNPFRARWVLNEIWHPDQRGQLLEDGSYLLDIPYLDDRELLHDILRQGSGVKVLEPAELRTRVVEELQAMIANAQT